MVSPDTTVYPDSPFYRHYRFFLLLIIVLLVTMGVMETERRRLWLKDKSYPNCRYHHAIHKRGARRYVARQNLATASPRPLRHRQVGTSRKRVKEAGCVLSTAT